MKNTTEWLQKNPTLHSFIKDEGEKKMEQDLNREIGTQEMETLQAEPVAVMKASVEVVGEKGNKKVILSCKHPKKEELIKLSGVKYEKKDKIVTTGLWYNLDDAEKVRKGSALAILMEFAGCKTVLQLEGKTLATTTDDKGYLVFKAY